MSGLGLGDLFDMPWWRVGAALIDGKIVIRKCGDGWWLMGKGFEEPVKAPDFETARYTAAWCVNVCHGLDLEKLLR